MFFPFPASCANLAAALPGIIVKITAGKKHLFYCNNAFQVVY